MALKARWFGQWSVALPNTLGTSLQYLTLWQFGNKQAVVQLGRWPQTFCYMNLDKVAYWHTTWVSNLNLWLTEKRDLQIRHVFTIYSDSWASQSENFTLLWWLFRLTSLSAYIFSLRSLSISGGQFADITVADLFYGYECFHLDVSRVRKSHTRNLPGHCSSSFFENIHEQDRMQFHSQILMFLLIK